jgi:hypothetical protein
LATHGPIVPALDDDGDGDGGGDDDDYGDVGTVGGIELARKPKYPEKLCPSPPLLTINPT